MTNDEYDEMRAKLERAMEKLGLDLDEDGYIPRRPIATVCSATVAECFGDPGAYRGSW